MVQGETVLSMLKTPGCPLSPIWMARYYVGCLAVYRTAEAAKPSVTLYFHLPTCQRGGPRRFRPASKIHICSTGQALQQGTTKTDLIYTQVRTEPHPSLGREEDINTRMQSGAMENWRRLLLSPFLK